MKRVHKTNIGTLIFIGTAGLIFFGLTLITAFTFGGAPLSIRLGCSIATILIIYGFLSMLKYDVIITDDCISAKIPALSLFNIYQTMKFEDVLEVSHAMGLFPEQTVILLKSHNKKLISFMVGFGLPWDALRDILEKLPKDIKINFEPYVWKKIKNPRLPDASKPIIITAIALILLSLPFVILSCSKTIIRK